jgi:NADH:ubiquinone oxidoreductase subunit E
MNTTHHEITVCTGTTCYVMGGAELLDDLERAIDAGEISGCLRGSTCLGHCKAGEPPYIVIDDTVLAAPTGERIKAIAEKEER